MRTPQHRHPMLTLVTWAVLVEWGIAMYDADLGESIRG